MIGPVSRQARAVLLHPDRGCAWVVVVAVTLDHEATDVSGRLVALHAGLPIAGARLSRMRWVPGPPPEPLVVHDEPLECAELLRPFDLSAGPPMRVVTGGGGRRLAVAGHHAAFDGQALVAIVCALAGGPTPQPAGQPPAATGGSGSVLALARRLGQPADRVAPSPARVRGEQLVAVDAALTGPDVTARLAASCVEAFGEHNRAHGWPWRRIGVSLGIGGAGGVGNLATYRRVDVDVAAPSEASVRAVLRRREEPIELVSAPRLAPLLQPLVGRLSDSFLVSNVGRRELPGVQRIEFFPVARGRSAVAVGAAGVAGGPATVTLRARHLSRDDATALLRSVVTRFASGR